MVKFERCMDRRWVFTNKRRLKGKNMSITECLTKIRVSALKEARHKFGYSSVWTAGGKIMYKDKGNTKPTVGFDGCSGKQKLCYKKKQYLFLILIALFYFY